MNLVYSEKRIIVIGGSGFIGSHLIEDLLKINENFKIINIDIHSPKLDSQLKYWRELDILNKQALHSVISEYKPHIIFHLAATTNVDGKNLSQYKANNVGIKNLLDVLKDLQQIERVIFVSTQYVHQFHGFPKSDLEFFPYTVYGESKVESERIVRSSNLNFPWVIVRPTNVFGPLSEVYLTGLWRYIYEGKYFHPGRKKVIRSYGFVKNVTDQMIKLAFIEQELVDKKVFYLGDPPIILIDFVNKFTFELTGRSVKILPRFFFNLAALVGDLLKILGISFPITRNRLRNMIVDNPVPIEKTFKILGSPKYSIDYGVKKSCEWFVNEYKNRQP